ncbi:hypothetical protein PISMIDRAFT_676968 [Pisolithus microcarpus 441]|uniref:Uncharacterized protein n=1 Tax=Pisolithus microcarpus 441 TaxID=765257 RepID=A0A0C9YKY9_9AGAM|nr:hypothetical protein PISMIDRAFT_676968 [Pisolithus microcarpus 441]
MPSSILDINYHNTYATNHIGSILNSRYARSLYSSLSVYGLGTPFSAQSFAPA